MDTESIRFAFAVDNDENFVAKHFGDADKYLIYEWVNNEFVFLKEEVNRFKSSSEVIEHGSVKKGLSIMEFLLSLNVLVLVSRQFGKNIQMVNRLFIPVIVYSEEPAVVLETIGKHIKWIKDELKNNSGSYGLFMMKNGIIRKTIREKD